MGMAASQARFLGLTARKSNVEYQAQQINQQRTALANESANLYNQMMTLDVPTPPSSSDFYKNTYVLDDSAINNCSNYEILDMSKIYDGGENRYHLTLSTKESIPDGINMTSRVNSVTRTTKDDNTTYSIKLSSQSGTPITYNDKDCTPYEQETVGETTKNVLKIDTNKIYKYDAEAAKLGITGYESCKDDLVRMKEETVDGVTEQVSYEPQVYFYKDSKGKNHFLTQVEIDAMTKFDENKGKVDGDNWTPTELDINSAYEREIQKTITKEVDASVEMGKNGRVSSIDIDPDESYDANLKGASFSITSTRVRDDDAYEQAMNDYEYEKELYDKAISDINAKTEVVQKQDQQLELRIDQLDTEQNAINTEMDSVQKVIEDNVEKTFNIFG